MYGVGVSSRRARVVLPVVVAVIALIAAACSGSDTTTNQATSTTAVPTTSASDAQAAPPGADFCLLGVRVMAEQGVASLNQFSPQYFSEVDTDFAALLSVALPLATYSVALAVFGLAHVLFELR